ncbi:MAG: glycosyltransferase [Clostridia bacterium]|nr:glycosyltransferase [Clostridia bacterium]
MKVLLCERNFSGHRRIYLKWLSKTDGIEFFSFAPENTGFREDHFHPFITGSSLKSFKGYLSWIRQIRRIVKRDKIDVVHILDGDSLMRWFGCGLHSLGCDRVIVTYHNFYPGTARRISYRLMNLGRGHTCVVHSETLRQQMTAAGIKNAAHCEYPAFEFDAFAGLNSAQCKADLQMRADVPVIGIIGGISCYKNIIPFLHILQKTETDFQLLMLGRLTDITEQEITEATEPYKQKVRCMLRPLTDEEYKSGIAASDVIYCIYRRDFNGASGPLTDGVCCRKMILSSDHGTLGNITQQNHLGFTADVTDEKDILKNTEAALRQALSFKYDETAELYRDLLRPAHFLETYKKIYGI